MPPPVRMAPPPFSRQLQRLPGQRRGTPPVRWRAGEKPWGLLTWDVNAEGQHGFQILSTCPQAATPSRRNSMAPNAARFLRSEGRARRRFPASRRKERTTNLLLPKAEQGNENEGEGGQVPSDAANGITLMSTESQNVETRSADEYDPQIDTRTRIEDGKLLIDVKITGLPENVAVINTSVNNGSGTGAVADPEIKDGMYGVTLTANAVTPGSLQSYVLHQVGKRRAGRSGLRAARYHHFRSRCSGPRFGAHIHAGRELHADLGIGCGIRRR